MPELTMEEFWNKLLNIYSETMGKLMRNPAEWQSFLRASSYYYKMRFDQQIMVYAQKPNAKVIAESDQWYRLYRPVKPEGSAIYVFKDEYRKAKRYLRYYEPSETRTTKRSMRIPTWKMKPEYQTSIAEALRESFENPVNELKIFDTSSFESVLLSAAEVVTSDNIESYYDNLLNDTEFSVLDNMPENEALTLFDRIVVNSVGYSILSRLGINPDEHIDPSVFNDIQKFNTEEVLGAVGKATQQLSQTALAVIARTVKQYENTYNMEAHSYDRRTNRIDTRRISRVQENDTRREDRVQSESARERLTATRTHRNGRGIPEEISQQEQRVVVSAEQHRGRDAGRENNRNDDIRTHDRDAGGRGAVGGNIRSQKEGIFGKQEVSEVRENAVLRSAEQTLQSDSSRMRGTGGATLQGNGTDRRTDGGTEEKRPDGLGTDEQPHQSKCTGDNPQRQGLRLTETESDEQKAEIEDNSTSAFSYTQELIDKFFVYEESQSITWMYYNPDSTTGGQFVTNTLTFDEVAEAAGRYDSADDFFDHLGSIARQVLSDIGSEWFESALEEFNGVASYEGCSEETMKALADIAKKTLGMNNNVTVTVTFSEHPAFYFRDTENEKIVDRYNILSFAAANRLFEILDKKQHSERVSKEIGWYHKTDFVVKGTVNGEEIEYSGRYDIGDGDGSIISHIESYYDYMLKPDSYKNYQLSDKEIEESIEQLKADKEKITGLLTAVSELTDNDVHIVNEVMATEPDWYPETAAPEITADMYDISSSKEEIQKLELTPDNDEPLSLFDFAQTNAEETEKTQTADLSDRKEQNFADTKVTIDTSQQKKSTIDFDLTIRGITEVTVGKKIRFRHNIDAIRVLKDCISENRNATAPEQETMSQYVGWGGLQEAFNPNNTAWHKEYNELRELLTEEEYSNASSSTLTAFYTPPVVIKSIYKALESFGFEKGNILEPSCGIGNFIGMLPGEMKNSKIYGVEMENISAGISSQLYQSATIFCKPFEKAGFSDNFFDIVVGNVPFNDIKVVDARYQKYKFYIHDYFFAKSLDKLRPGGIAALITSQGTMDRTNTAVRKYIAQRAELIGAVRLPNDTFGGNAGANGVTSDILFLQKRERICDIEPDWIHLGIDDNGIRMNQYFIEHPEMILGEMKMISSAYGPKSSCIPIEGTDLEAMLNRAVDQLTAQISEYKVEFDEEIHTIPADPNVRNNSYTIINGKLYYRVDSLMEERNFENERKGKSKTERIKAMIPLRDCTRKLIDFERENYADEVIEKQQRQLNALYDTFVIKYGRLNDNENSNAFKEDSCSALLASLEVIDGEGKFKEKSAIFTKRTINPYIEITKADTVQEALAISLSEKAYVDMPYLMNLTGKTEDEVFAELDGAVFLNPGYNEKYTQHTEQKYVPRDEYLSGNVREKLRTARFYADSNAAFNANVTALQAAQPKDLTPSEISVSVGSTWIPANYYTDFVYHFAGLNRTYHSIEAVYSEYTSTWQLQGKKRMNNANINIVYGTNRMNGLEIFERMLNLKQIKVFDSIYENGKQISVLNEKETELAKDKQEEIELAFEQWIWSDPTRRRELVTIYNEKFNAIVPRHYDGSHLTFPGMNPEISLFKHQKDAAARIIYGGNTLLAHCVGAGKTFTMITASQELKRLGLCNKSLIVVPIHLLKQWKNEYMRLYPGANILVSTPDDFSAKGRNRFIAKIATGDYDAIIITQSQFAKIQLSPEKRLEYIQEELEKVDQIIEKTYDNYTVKQLEKARKQLKTKLDILLAESKKDDMIYFDELGVDRIFVDEAHAYKNLYHVTKMSNVSGLVSRESQRATSMHFICRYLDEKTNGKGVIFATGTPLANSLSEVYTIMSNLQIGLLNKTNMQFFDNWASTFARAVTEFELATEGNSLIEKTRFSQFINVPELRIMAEEVMDVQTANTLKLNVPKAIRITELNPPSEIQKEIMSSFAERADSFRRKAPGYRRQEMLLIANDGKKMSLDQRVYDPDLPPAEDSKISRCAKNVYELYVKYNEIKGTQMVFCDLSVPNAKNKTGYCAYEDLKEQLIKKGIPEQEIKFIHEANTDEKKDKLFRKVRSGEVRVLIGSTEKMGTGTNAQDRLIGLHHLTCPWRPIDLEQREGRIIRQGNMNSEVYIYTYVTEGTFDANMYQTVARKQRIASQFLSEDPPRTCEDIDEATLTYYDIAALTTGNPLIKEQAELQKEIAKLQRQKITYDNQNYTLQDRVEVELPKQIQLQKTAVNALMSDSSIAKEHPKGDEFCGIEVEERLYSDRKQGGEALQAVLHSPISTCESVSIGSYRGFDLRMEYDIKHRVPIVCLKGNAEYKATYSESSTGIIAKLDNIIANIEEKLEKAQNRLDSFLNEEIESRKALKMTFPYADELEKKKARFEEINRELSQDKVKVKAEISV